jgi:hypothetical protein
MKIPVLAFFRFTQTAIALATIEPGNSDESLKGPEHVSIRVAVYRKDQRVASNGMSHNTSAQFMRIRFRRRSAQNQTARLLLPHLDHQSGVDRSGRNQ